MANKLKPSDFNRKVAFGDVKTVTNPNTGGKDKEFVADFSLWYAPKTRTLHQQYELIGTKLENTKVIITHHNPKIEGMKMAKIGDVVYDIEDYSPDETNSYLTYDYITLKRRS